MSTLKLENIKHENSSSNNLVLDSDGNVIIGTGSDIGSKLSVNSQASFGTDNNNRGIIDYSSNVLSMGTIQSGTANFSTVNVTGGKVGIETNNPLSIFHIGGGGDANVPITVAPSTGGNAEFRNTSSTGSFTFTNANGSNEHMAIDASGRVTTPNQPAFMTHGNAGWQVSTAGSNITFGGVAFNTSNSYNSTSHRFTAPVAGKYMFITTLYQDNTYDCRFCMTINGSQLSSFGDVIPYGYTRGPTTSGETTLSIQYIANLNLNDYVEVKQRVGYGSARVYTSHSHFGGYLIG